MTAEERVRDLEAEVVRLRAALRHIADHYDAETAAHVPATIGEVGQPGPHQWVELSRWIELLLVGSDLRDDLGKGLRQDD